MRTQGRTWPASRLTGPSRSPLATSTAIDHLTKLARESRRSRGASPVDVPHHQQQTWNGFAVDNAQIYPG